MLNQEDSDHARDRIMEAALDVFAERGYKATTVRSICAQAGVNVAAIQYYFGGKEALYRKALAFSFQQADRKYPQDALLDDSLPAEDRLHRFIRSMVHRFMDDSHLGRHGKLVAREIADPTGALNNIVDTVMRPRYAVLRELIPQLAGPGWSLTDIDRFICSIMGQCLVYRHSRPLVERLSPDIVANAQAVDRTVEMIFQFSLAALRQLAINREDDL